MIRLDRRRQQTIVRSNNRTKRNALRLEHLEDRRLLAFTFELLHVTDQEGSTAEFSDITNLSAVLNALESEDLGSDGQADNTLRLSSGDAFIPGLFFEASEAVFGSPGIADVQIQNELGFQAVALGNHEFDFGTATLAGLIDGSAAGDFSALSGTALDGADFTGTKFPYLSSNLDFSTDAALAPRETPGGLAPLPNTLTSSVVIDVNGESIGVVGATTPTLATISSPGTVGISPSPFGANPTAAEIDSLAATIQSEVDALTTADPSLNKVIVLAHMQQLDIEIALAERLVDVDIIVAGGSNTRLFDSDDRARAGDSSQGMYPMFVTADPNGVAKPPVAVVNTDGSYKYVGRLVIDFNDAGEIEPASYDPSVSGAYATDDQGVSDLGAEGLVDPEVQAIVDAVESQIISTEGNVFGVSNVFLNGNRSGVDAPDDPDGVRTQETNLGNLTADANLAAAVTADGTVKVSIKNGGGIRASIGQTVVPPGGTGEPVRQPNSAIFDSEGNEVKPEGGISENDIKTTLAFNNGLILLTLTRQEMLAVLEHGVSAIPGVSGRFGHFSGIEFAYDPSLDAGSRVQSAALVDEAGNVMDVLVKDGALVGDPTDTIRIVTLDFLAASRFDDQGNFIGAGDGYPFPNFNTDPTAGAVGDPATIARVNAVNLEQEGVTTGDATFADDGTEQDALAEYLKDNFFETPYAEADTGRDSDEQIQNLSFRTDTIFEGLIIGTPGNDVLVGTSDDDRIFGLGGDDVLLGLSGSDSLFGGPGNDVLFGGFGNDILLGGLGTDDLFGGFGDDVLIGGLGRDRMFGNFGSDLLIGGQTVYDHSEVSLRAISAKWSSADSYTDRVNSLRTGNGAPVLDSTTVKDDGERDKLFGRFGRDWFVDGEIDLLSDRRFFERVG